MKALQSLKDKEYLQTLADLVKKKDRTLKSPTLFSRRHKLVVYVQGKGYEADLAWEIVRELYPE